MSHVVFLHTDFRLGWLDRLGALNAHLIDHGHRLTVVELFGKGGNYSFDKRNGKSQNIISKLDWRCLFPDSGPHDIVPLTAKRTAVKYLLKLDADIVFAGAIAFSSGAAAADWGIRMSRPVVVMDDATLDDVPRSKFVNFIKKNIYNCVDGLMFPTIEGWKHTAAYWGKDESKLYGGVAAIDLNFWSECRHDLFRINNNFLMAGRLISLKNFDIVIEAFRHTNADSCLTIVGEGEQKHVLIDMIENYGLIDRVHILPMTSRYNLRALYQRSKATIVMSNRETWCNVIAESMASGCPVVATQQCGAAKCLIKDGHNGWTMPRPSVYKLAEKVDEICSMDFEEYSPIRLNAMNSTQQLDTDRFCQEVNRAITSLLSAPKEDRPRISKWITLLWNGRYRAL